MVIVRVWCSLVPKPLSFFCVRVGKERVWYVVLCNRELGSYLIYRVYLYCSGTVAMRGKLKIMYAARSTREIKTLYHK